MKYIVIQINIKGTIVEHPYIFPDTVNHDDFANYMIHNYIMNYKNTEPRVVSAGFCNLVTSTLNCNGRSETLNIDSRRDEDDKLISMFNYEHGLIG